MFRLNLHETYIVKKIDLEPGEEIPEHKQNFFELVFIEKGEGFHIINNARVPYKKRDVFLLAPEDEHFGEVLTPTTVTLIRFTELFFSGKSSLPDRSYWLRHIEHILHHPNLLPGVAVKDPDDLKIVWLTKDLLCKEHIEEQEFHMNIISNNISTILSIIARNIIKNYALEKGVEPTVYINKADEVLSYIRQNIYDTERMKIEHLADKFHMSPNYINSFFKKETGETIRQYILNYKLMVTEFRLKYTNSSISEIAHQVGFTDESHLSKAFKKKNKMTPNEFRKQYSPYEI
ncbi:AraC family transcriptional regulator [Robertkochia aurantiaca]|uniref:AraC family transcriptional regulator n=1 Tax=Robertkochia aurantiaca TaxID=2873700 RepID=UPI001CCDC7B1|nr:AraC family transcriptional regulator [Robertkochia sp. 3YJGBD-33]